MSYGASSVSLPTATRVFGLRGWRFLCGSRDGFGLGLAAPADRSPLPAGEPAIRGPRGPPGRTRYTRTSGHYKPLAGARVRAYTPRVVAKLDCAKAFVPARYDYGPLNIPVRGFGLHMAEGGGTVGYLANNPARGVSVHFVVQYDGDIVQMLAIDHACGGMNPDDRSTNKVYYGHDILVAVLGTYWTDPNAATIQVEIEGFAKDGPNPKQVAALLALAAELRIRVPSIRGAIGHADQTDTKKCPGTTPAMRGVFDSIGGHGVWSSDPVPMPIVSTVPVLISAPKGKRYDVDGKTVLATEGIALIDRYSPYKVENGMHAFYGSQGGGVIRVMLAKPLTVEPIPIPEPPDITAIYNSGVDAASAAAQSARKPTV